MEHSFWEGRWLDNQIGWHQSDTERLLLLYGKSLNLKAGSSVLLPCCGKSLDLKYFSEQGYPVTGLELSEVACSSFFEENSLEHTIEKRGDFKHFISEKITLIQGDLFAFDESGFKFDFIYDRAALIALSKEQRRAYAKKIISWIKPAGHMFLISLEFDESKKPPPPHSVSEEEIHELYEEHFSIEALTREDVLAESEKFKLAGIESLDETTFLLKGRP
jgi:thiopurine S-methyltransferase